MTNLEKISDIDFLATLICKQNIDDLADAACRSMQISNNGNCAFGEDGPEDFTECVKCNKRWLQEEAID